MENIFTKVRNSRMSLGEVYYWIDTIKDCKHLLKQDKYKMVIIDQLLWLKNNKKIAVYAFVIMPNHLHIVWEMVDKNGKEMPHASFNKWTSRTLLNDLRIHLVNVLPFFIEETKERKHRFWQRDPLAVIVNSKIMAEQKINYIHTNPLQPHWNLAITPEEYHWSSANFYKTGVDEFGFLTHYSERF